MRERGSAYLFVVMIVATIAGFVLLATSFGVHIRKVQTRRELAARTEMAFLGALARIEADRDNGNLTQMTREESIEGVFCRTVITDAGVLLPGSLRVDGHTNVAGATFRYSTFIADVDRNLLSYALAANGPITSTFGLITGSQRRNGSIFSNGPIDLGLLSIINGNAESTSTIGPTSLTISGEKLEYAAPKSFPVTDSLAYQDAATTVLMGGNMNGYAFPPSSGTFKPLVVVQGTLNLRGSLSGVGTLYIVGDLKYTGPTSYLDENSHVAFIVTGDLRVGNYDIVGAHYVQGAAVLNGTLPCSISPGSVVAGTVALNRPTTIVADPAISSDRRAAYQHRLPGYWP